MNRSKRKLCAQETVSVLEQGFYKNQSRQKIDLKNQIDRSKSGTIVFDSDFETEVSESTATAAVTLANETTFDAVRGLHQQFNRIACLNFASAKNPGGGFLNGSQAQEEALARASSLHSSILMGRKYYDENRASENALYKNLLIYSPEVAIFRLENGDFMDQPVSCDIITAPAVNVGGLKQQNAVDLPLIEKTMRGRMQLIFKIAVKHDIDCLVLGAWGCGVFQQNPNNVAKWFKEELKAFQGRFKRIHFAVLDRSNSHETYNAFAEVFDK